MISGGLFERFGRGDAYFDVAVGDVADDVVLIIHDSKGRHAFVVHQTQGFFEGFVAAVRYDLVTSTMTCAYVVGGLLDRNQLLRPNIKILDGLRVELVNGRETSAVLPQKSDEPQLAQDSNDIVCALMDYHDPMYASSERLNRFRQVCCV